MARDIVFIRGKQNSGGTRSYSPILPTSNRSWDMILAEPGVPLLDSELTLMGQITRTKIEDFITAFSLPGWIPSSIYPLSNSSNLNLNSSNRTIQIPSCWFIANGHVLRIASSTNPGDPNSNGSTGGNVAVSLGSMPTGTRTDLAFLEFYRYEVGPLTSGAGSPGTASDTDVTALETGEKGTSRTQVYEFGGTSGNGNTQANTPLTNDLIGTLAGATGNPFTGTFGETTRRVQIRWRIRIVEGVNFTQFPYGLGSNNGSNSTIVAQGGMDGHPSGVAGYPFTMIAPFDEFGTVYNTNPTEAEAYGKGRLWRAGAGTIADAQNLNTVDGFVYAVPILMINMAATGNVNNTGFVSAVDLRQLSHVFIPNHALHADQLCAYDDPAQPGVYGAGFETAADTERDGVTHKSNIRRKSITGGPNGDIALGTVTSDNLGTGVINNTSLIDNSITINKTNIDTLGLATVRAINNTGGSVTNGLLVLLTADLANFSTATLANSGPGTVIGVVANYGSDGAAAPIANNQPGYIRLQGQVAVLNVNGAVTAGTPLMVSPTVSGAAEPANGTADVIGYALNTGTGTVRALIISRTAENSIRTSKIVNGAVSAAKIATGAVTDAHISLANINGANNVPSMRTIGSGAGEVVSGTDGRLTDARRPDPNAAATGDLAGSVFGGLVIAQGAVNTGKLADHTVTSLKVQIEGLYGGQGGNIAAGTINSYNLQNRSILPDRISSNSITQQEMASNSIGNAQLQTNAVDYPNIAPLAIRTNHINNQQIINQHILDGTIGPGKLSGNAVISGNIAPGAIVNSNLFAAGVVNGTAIAPGAINVSHIGLKQVRDELLGVRYYTEVSRVTPITIPSTDVGVVNNSLNSNYSIVPFDSIVYDTTHSFYLNSPSWSASSPTIVTVRKDGLYFVQLVAHIAGGANNWYFEVSLATPGTARPFVIDGRFANNATINTTGHQMSLMPWNVLVLTAGTQIEFRIFALITPNAAVLTINEIGMKLLRIGEIA